MKQDFVPEEEFSWDFDLEKTSKGKKGKKSKQTAAPVSIIRSNPNMTSQDLPEIVKLRLSKEIDFHIINLDKLNKCFTNKSNCCFMNVCLQSLLACPPFINMLFTINGKEDIIKDLGEESLLRKFVELSKYFNPTEQIDKKSKYAVKTVNAEQIFE